MTEPKDLWLIRYTWGDQTIYRGFERKHEAEEFADWALRNAESFSVARYVLAVEPLSTNARA